MGCGKSNDDLAKYDENSEGCTEDNWWTTNRGAAAVAKTNICCESVELTASPALATAQGNAACGFPANPTECCAGLESVRVNFETDSNRCDALENIVDTRTALVAAICDRPDCRSDNPVCTSSAKVETIV